MLSGVFLAYYNTLTKGDWIVNSVIKWVLFFIFVSLLSGCWTSGPENQLGFNRLNDLKQLKGVYINKGETGTDKEVYLSQVLWGYEVFGAVPVTTGQTKNSWIERAQAYHAKVEKIQVVPSSDTEVTVSAISKQCIAYERKYIYGEDFKFIKGKIYIKRESHLLSRGSGDVLVGPSYEETVLGVDEAGDGKYQDSGYFAGLAYLVLPFAAGGTKDVRFSREDMPFVTVKCKK